MKKFYPISLVLFLVFIAVAMILSGPGFGVYLSVSSLIIVVGLPLVILLATHSPREMSSAFRAAYQSSDPVELRASVVFFSAMQRYLLWSGVLATMVGVVAMLSVLGEKSSVGAGAALALLTVFYSIILNLTVALPFRHAAEKRLAHMA